MLFRETGHSSTWKGFKEDDEKMAEYRDTLKVVNEALGVTLALKRRLDTDYYTVVWRQKRPSNTNRRFYFEQDSFWSMPADAALDMMEKAQAKGLFLVKYSRWPGERIDPSGQRSVKHGKGERAISRDADAWVGRRRVVGVPGPPGCGLPGTLGKTMAQGNGRMPF